MEFSTSSLTTDAGLSTTSAAGIWAATLGGGTWMSMVLVGETELVEREVAPVGKKRAA